MFIFFDIVLLFIFLPLSFFFSYFLVCFTSLSLMIQLWFFNLILLFFLLILTSLKLSFESHDRKVLIGRICAQRQSPAHEIGTSDFVAWGISNLIHPSLQMDLTWNDAHFLPWLCWVQNSPWWCFKPGSYNIYLYWRLSFLIKSPISILLPHITICAFTRKKKLFRKLGLGFHLHSLIEKIKFPRSKSYDWSNKKWKKTFSFYFTFSVLTIACCRIESQYYQ